MEEIREFGFRGTVEETFRLMAHATSLGWTFQSNCTHEQGDITNQLYFTLDMDNDGSNNLQANHFWYVDAGDDWYSYADCILVLDQIGKVPTTKSGKSPESTWTDVNDAYPEEGLEVLCAITKMGMRTVDKSYTEPSVDKDGKKWWRVGEQVSYDLYWREDDKWVSWDNDDHDSNQDYYYVIAWQHIDHIVLKEKEV